MNEIISFWLSLTKRGRIMISCIGLLVCFPVLFVFILFLAGVKIFVVQPIGMIPNGITVVVRDFPGLNFIDSPDAVCNRANGGVSLLCRGAVVQRVVRQDCNFGFGERRFIERLMMEQKLGMETCFNKAPSMIHLPYISFLYSLTGAPTTDR